MFNLPRDFATRNVSLIIILTAVCVAGNYAFAGLLNINIMDIIVFTAGFVFGPLVGASIGALSWMIYGIINPFGFNLPIWLATMLGETVFGIVGGWRGKSTNNNIEKKIFKFNIEMALLGLILTMIYDLFTNIIFAFSFGASVTYAIVTGWLIPPWFGILHEASNTLLFFFAVHPLIKAIKRAKGGEHSE